MINRITPTVQSTLVRKSANSDDQSGKNSEPIDKKNVITVGSPLQRGPSKEALQAQNDLWEANSALNEAFAAHKKIEFMERVRANIAELTETEPVPAVQLTAEEADVIRQKLSADGRGVRFGESDTFMALLDDNLYTFKKDGTATVQQNGVPSSQEEKQTWLLDARQSLEAYERATGWLSNEELEQNLKLAEEAAKAAAEKLARLKGDALDGAGQTHDRRI